MQTEVMNYDVLVVGAGPSGLSAAIHLKQLSQLQKTEISVAVLEKGSSVGANIISGCVMDPRGLSELIPNWQDLNFPVTTKVNSEKLLFLTKSGKFNLPLPKEWSNEGNYIISLGQLCQRMAAYAEDLGVEIYPGFAAKTPIFENECLVGIITGEMGVLKDGNKGNNYQPGMEIRAKQIIISEGCRGSLAKQVIKKFDLCKDKSVQTYGLGIKEIWQVKGHGYQEGTVLHTIGFPLNNNAYGGGFLYHLGNNLVSVGLVTALDYSNPYLNPYAEFQKLKLHPQIVELLKGGKRIEYGARTVVEGGVQALPKLTFPGGVLVGDSAGFINVPKIKGVHNAIKSGMLCAKAIFESPDQVEAKIYEQLVKKSWLYEDLYAARNIRPAFRLGLFFGLLYSAIDRFVLLGKAPWTFKLKVPDNQRLKDKRLVKQIQYNKPDGIISFDRNSSLNLANISHTEDQPCHLQLEDLSVPIQVNLEKYDAPETRYCPAGVYEIVNKDTNPKLLINAQNCVHCKACDIKDPKGNITWVPPEGGNGPQYSEM